jgi:hypothetical protein
MKSQAQINFESDVAAHLREDAMEIISEAAMYENHGHDDVHIIDRDWIDVLNVRCHGSINIDDKEYSFIVEVGNRSGFLLEDWEGAAVFAPCPRIEWTLAPMADMIDRVITSNDGPILLELWDAVMTLPEVAKIPQDYMYDKHFQPGVAIRAYYREKAAKYKMILVTKNEADEIRARLAAADGAQSVTGAITDTSNEVGSK